MAAGCTLPRRTLEDNSSPLHFPCAWGHLSNTSLSNTSHGANRQPRINPGTSTCPETSGAEYNRHLTRSAVDLLLPSGFFGCSVRSVSKTLISGNGAQAARCRGPWGTSVPSACPQSTPGGQGVQDQLLLQRRRRSPAGASGGNVLSHKDHPSSCGCRARSERSSLLQAHPLTRRVSGRRSATLCSITKGNDKNVLPPPLLKLRNPDTIHDDKDCLSGTDDKEGSCAPNKADIQRQALW